jgi:hypothetical protein
VEAVDGARAASRAVTGSLLPLPDDPRLERLLQGWPGAYSFRSQWLHDFEAVLREWFPAANSDSLTLTARVAAPFPLALPNVP